MLEKTPSALGHALRAGLDETIWADEAIATPESSSSAGRTSTTATRSRAALPRMATGPRHRSPGTAPQPAARGSSWWSRTPTAPIPASIVHLLASVAGAAEIERGPVGEAPIALR